MRIKRVCERTWERKMARCQFHQILAWKWSVICGLGLAVAWTHIFACARAGKTRRSFRLGQDPTSAGNKVRATPEGRDDDDAQHPSS